VRWTGPIWAAATLRIRGIVREVLEEFELEIETWS